MSDPCVGTLESLGLEYREFSCLYPQIEPLYSNFEKNYDPVGVLDYMSNHPMIPIVACVIYCILIFGGQYLMKNRECWKWRNTLAAWNFLLSVFSGIGMVRTLPHLLHNLATYSFRDNFCLDPRTTYGSGSTGLWVQLFILSKFPELFDTFFHCNPQETTNFPSLVSSYHGLALLLAFLRYNFPTWHLLCGDELLCPCKHVLLLFFDGNQNAAKVVESYDHHNFSDFPNDSWCRSYFDGILLLFDR
mmetsp:Transcript_18350/g.27734  ORF Transcript_18350/g.27734 Transcript_18350/m.27734 type:complete len:246 (+) Transcript_18350:103-840(+)